MLFYYCNAAVALTLDSLEMMVHKFMERAWLLNAVDLFLVSK
jgi:hypothetical protein